MTLQFSQNSSAYWKSKLLAFAGSWTQIISQCFGDYKPYITKANVYSVYFVTGVYIQDIPVT